MVSQIIWFVLSTKLIVNAARIPPRPLSGSEGLREACWEACWEALGALWVAFGASWEAFWELRSSSGGKWAACWHQVAAKMARRGRQKAQESPKGRKTRPVHLFLVSREVPKRMKICKKTTA